MTLPIHIHSPTAHVGAIISTNPSQQITAWDAFLLLHSLATDSLNYDTIFADLPEAMQVNVKSSFREQLHWDCGESDRACEGYRLVDNAQSRGSLGIDLLFGNSQVWGFEECSMGRFSIIHVANVKSY
jgi:hypothetical protein